MDVKRRFVTKAIITGLGVAAVAPTRLFAQEAKPNDAIKAYKLDLNPVQSQVSLAKLADLQRIRMDAIVDLERGWIIGGDFDQLTTPLASASWNKQPAFMVIQDFLNAGETLDGKPLSLDTKLPNIVIDVVKADGTVLKDQRYIFNDISLGDGLEYIVVASKNKVLDAIIKLVAGNEEVFVALMNAKARECGMSNTCFLNASGLPGDEDFIVNTNDSLSSVTTMEDWAKLLIKMEQFYPEYKKYSQMRSIAVERNIGGMASVDRFKSTSALLADRGYRRQVEQLGLEKVSPKTGTTDLGRIEADTAILDGTSLGVITCGHPHLVNENYIADGEKRRYVEEKDRPDAVLKGFQDGQRILALEAERIEQRRKEQNAPKNNRGNKDPFARPGPTMIA